MSRMHEWVLLSVDLVWESARATFSFETPESGAASLVAEGVTDLHVPQMKPWGPSVHVNEVRESSVPPGNRRKLEIEMQSGDVIAVSAAAFVFPKAARGAAGQLETTADRRQP